MIKVKINKQILDYAVLRFTYLGRLQKLKGDGIMEIINKQRH